MNTSFTINEESKKLASLALFKELYDSHKDVYAVLYQFIEEIIGHEGLNTFTALQITQILNDTYDYEIPQAVVKTTLKRFDYLQLAYGTYSVDRSKFNFTSKISEKYSTEIKFTQDLVQGLFNYLEMKLGKNLNEKEKQIASNEFGGFILQDSRSGEYIEYISAYVIDKKDDAGFQQAIDSIYQGLILYSGVKYDTESMQGGKWKDELVIYLDTEIIFHFMGFNGILYKQLFTDFLGYVQEINRKSKSKVIQLKYFTETKNEIDAFFSQARRILEGKEPAAPNVTAMNSILNGCNAPSDIVEKKAQLELVLKSNQISEHTTDYYYSIDNRKYNLINQEKAKTLSEDLHFDIANELKYLNYVHIDRGTHTFESFYKSRYILLTGKSRTLKIAWHKTIKGEGNVPLATSMDWLTNKMWLHLNKGFGNGQYPLSFKRIIKAKLVLSSILSDRISQKYETIVNKYKAGELKSEIVTAQIVELRNLCQSPENIDEDNIDSILESISEDVITKHINEQEIAKEHAKRVQQENDSLKKQIQEKDNLISQTNRRVIQNLEIQLKSKIEQSAKLDNRLKQINKKSRRKTDNFRMVVTSIFLIYYLVLIFFIFTLGWDKMEKWTFIFGIPPFILNFVATKIYCKSFSLRRLLDAYEKKRKNDLLLEFEISEKDLEVLQSEIASLKVQISKLNDSSSI